MNLLSNTFILSVIFVTISSASYSCNEQSKLNISSIDEYSDINDNISTQNHSVISEENTAIDSKKTDNADAQISRKLFMSNITQYYQNTIAEFLNKSPEERAQILKNTKEQQKNKIQQCLYIIFEAYDKSVNLDFEFTNELIKK